MAKQQVSLVKYINAIKQSPREIYNRHLFISVIAFALGGCAKGMILPLHTDTVSGTLAKESRLG